MIYVSVIIALFSILLIFKSLVIVKQSEVMIIERLGKYNRTLSSGINFLIPFVDSFREMNWRRYMKREGYSVPIISLITRIDLRETVLDFPRQSVITKDNVSVEINAILYFQIMDAYKSIYEIENLTDGIEKLTQTTLRNIIGELELDETLSSRDTINKRLGIVLDEATNKWGVKVNRVELQDVNPPEDIKNAMEKQMRAERDRRAQILEAEGLKKSQILKAEGIKESQILEAEGSKQSQILRATGEADAKIKVAKAEAEAVELVSKAVSKEDGDPINYMVAIRYVDTLKDMVSGKDSKTIYMPYEATGILSSIGGIKDLLKENK